MGNALTFRVCSRIFYSLLMYKINPVSVPGHQIQNASLKSDCSSAGALLACLFLVVLLFVVDFVASPIWHAVRKQEDAPEQDGRSFEACRAVCQDSVLGDLALRVLVCENADLMTRTRCQKDHRTSMCWNLKSPEMKHSIATMTSRLDQMVFGAVVWTVQNERQSLCPTAV